MKIVVGRASCLTIDKIGRFLYKTYVEEGRWQFGTDTPSMLRISTNKKGENILQDKFMESSIWSLAVKNNDIVGCFRMIDGREGPIELFGYQERSSTIENLRTEEGLIEVNRLALAKEFRGQNNYLQLLNGFDKWMKENDRTDQIVFSLPTNLVPHFGNFYEALGYKKVGKTFKYEDNDPHPVQLYSGHSSVIAKNLLEQDQKST